MVMTKAEYLMLKTLAETDGISASDYVRQFVHRAHRERMRLANLAAGVFDRRDRRRTPLEAKG
jgi:hypothetical protein